MPPIRPLSQMPCDDVEKRAAKIDKKTDVIGRNAVLRSQKKARHRRAPGRWRRQRMDMNGFEWEEGRSILLYGTLSIRRARRSLLSFSFLFCSSLVRSGRAASPSPSPSYDDSQAGSPTRNAPHGPPPYHFPPSLPILAQFPSSHPK